MEDIRGMIDEAPYDSDEMVVETDRIMDDMDADACIQKKRNWERYRKFWLDYYAKKIDEVNAKCDRNIAMQDRYLYEFFKSVPHRTTKTMESYDLPNGRISMSFAKSVLVPDKDAILERFKANGETEFIKVKTTEDIDWNAYKNRLFISDDGSTVFDKETGEVVNDVAIEQKEPEFKVKIAKEKGDDENE